MVDVASLVFDIDASGARTATTDLLKMGKAAVEVSNSADRLNNSILDSRGRVISLGASIEKNGQEVSELAREFNTSASAALKLQQYQIRLNQAVGAGIASQAEANILLKQKHAELQRGLPLIKQAEAATRATSEEDRRRADVLNKLNSLYTPLYASSKRYEASLNELNAALDRGDISGVQHARMLDTLNAKYSGTTKGAEKLTKGVGAATHQIQNMGYQVSDIAVQLAGGQNPILVLTQQLPQMIGGLGIAGAVVGSLAAIVGVLTMKFLGGTDAAKKFNDSLSSMKDTTSLLNEKLSFTVPESFQVILDKYGSLNASVRETVSNIEALNIQLIRLNQTGVEGLFAEDFGGYFSSRIGEMRDAFNATTNEANLLLAMISQLDKAKGPVEQIAAYDILIKKLIESAGGIDKMTAKQVGFIIKLEEGRAAAIQGAAALEKYAPPINAATVSATNLLGVLQQIANTPFPPMMGRFSPDDAGLGSILAPTSSRAPRRAPNDMWWLEDKDKLDKAATSKAKSAAKAGAAELKSAEKQFQSLRELMEQDSLFQVAEYEKRQGQLTTALQKRLITQQQYATMEQQLKLMYFGSEYEQNALQYQMNLEQLRAYLEQGYLTEQQYAAKRAQLQWEYSNQALDLNSTQLGANLNGLAGYFSQASSLAGGGYAGLLKAQQSFAAAGAFISAYSGAAQALADPTLTTWQKIAAAGKVLTTGLGFVNAIKSGGGSSASAGGSGAVSSSVATATPAEPERVTMVNIQGDKWTRDLIGSLMTEIYKQTKNGKVVVAGYRG